MIIDLCHKAEDNLLFDKISYVYFLFKEHCMNKFEVFMNDGFLAYFRMIVAKSF